MRCECRREEAPWCDFAFEVAGERITMHRVVMAARSPFMRRMLLTYWRLPVCTPRPCHDKACCAACGNPLRASTESALTSSALLFCQVVNITSPAAGCRRTAGAHTGQ